MEANSHAEPSTVNGVFVRLVNLRIREISDSFASVADDVPIDFLCECGCLALLPLTIAEFDARDEILVDGHSRA